MKFQVIIESTKTAVVKATYLNKDFHYIFLDIAFTPSSATGTILAGKGEFAFTSVHLRPPLAVGNPLRHKIISSEFHRRTDVNEVIKAASLEEACTAFFTPFQDTFQIVGEAPRQKLVAQTAKQRAK